MKEYETLHLVKGEDLNHHGTLFAARAAAWLVEAAFAAAVCECSGCTEIVCRSLHDMSFRVPVQKGSVIRFLTRIVYTGKTSLTAAVRVKDVKTGRTAVEGMITFVTVDEETGEKRSHHIVLDETADEEEIKQREAALAARK